MNSDRHSVQSVMVTLIVGVIERAVICSGGFSGASAWAFFGSLGLVAAGILMFFGSWRGQHGSGPGHGADASWRCGGR